ncbi:MAG: winged helix-turn-helix transcriptional regulator [Stappiaceae bacterium]
MDDLDKYDRNILSQLQQNGRITMTELAQRIGLSKTPCQLRVRRLENDGYIRGYKAILDPEKLGAGHIAFVQVRLTDTTAKALDAFNAAVRTLPAIEQCHMIAGGFDYLLKVRTSSIATYRHLLGESIASLPYVGQTSTFVAMETIVEPGPDIHSAQ